MSASDKIDSVRIAVNKAIAAVLGDKEDYDGTSDYFTTDQALGATPTLYVTLEVASDDLESKTDIKRFLLTNIRYLMDPTYTQTYRLYLLEAANADDYENKSDVVFDSGASQADGTAYDVREGGKGSMGAITTADYHLPVIVSLETANRFYYQIDWASGAPTSWVKGYIKVRGRPLK